MSLSDLLQHQRTGESSTMRGVAIGVVTNSQDPNGKAASKYNIPWRNVEDESDWTRMITFMAGNEMGGYFLPEVGDEVLVAFENGDIDHPVILGALWSAQMKPPQANDDGQNNLRLIKSRSGHQIILDDTEGSEKITIIDKSESNSIIIDTTSNTITIESAQDIQLKAPSGKISLEATELEFKANANAKLEAGANMDLKANGNATLKGAMVMIN